MKLIIIFIKNTHKNCKNNDTRLILWFFKMFFFTSTIINRNFTKLKTTEIKLPGILSGCWQIIRVDIWFNSQYHPVWYDRTIRRGSWLLLDAFHRQPFKKGMLPYIIHSVSKHTQPYSRIPNEKLIYNILCDFSFAWICLVESRLKCRR